jgi:hydrogenase-4 component B
MGAGLAGALAKKNERLTLALGLAGAVLGFAGGLLAVSGPASSALQFPFWGGPARIQADALSGAFLLPLNLMGGLGLVYGKSYLPLEAARASGRTLRLWYGCLIGALNLVFIARHGLLFLMAWELMAVAAFFLVSTDHEHPEVHRAGWVYLVSTHTGTLVLTGMVILMLQRNGNLLWLPMPGPGASLDTAILLLALLGFGFKASFVPLHFWLPAAHAAAPSHVSAILSGVMLKAGIYGILRVMLLLPSTPLWAGGLMLALGAATALFGVAYALAQSDYKRLLAYSSIENLGVVAMGVGLGMAGRAQGHALLASLGFGGAIFHTWNHALFKGLLFFGAGSVLHATGTRDMERLGGLAARMPKTAALVFPGVLAVAALPPFNAFLSEWLIYKGLFQALHLGQPWLAVLALPALAMTGALAAVAFARFFGTLFLGAPRSEDALKAHDPDGWMRWPMGVLGVLCLLMGLGCAGLLLPLGQVVALLAPGSAEGFVRTLGPELGRLSLALALLLLALPFLLIWVRKPGASTKPSLPTWDCGYAAPQARMQYTGSSFAQGWAQHLPGFQARVRTLKALFPKALSYRSRILDPIGDLLLESRVQAAAQRLLRFRMLQPGYLSVYLLYVLVALIAVIVWLLLRPWVLG